MALARGFLGKGDLYINRYVAGVLQGETGPFEIDRFEIKANGELRQRRSKSKANFGQPVATAAISNPFELSVTMGEVDSNGLSIALLGTSSTLTQTSGSITNEAIAAKLGVWVPLSKFQVSSVVVTNSAGTTTYVADTDYVVNAELGTVKALAGGAITEGQTIHVDFAHAAVTGSKIVGGTAASLRARFRFDGVNLADDVPTVVTVWEAVVASQAVIDFLSDEFLTIPLQGSLSTPAGKSGPFEIEIRGS